MVKYKRSMRLDSWLGRRLLQEILLSSACIAAATGRPSATLLCMRGADALD